MSSETSYPKISIVTPSYNQAPFLVDTIESVLGQGYPNLEYIIMDGGSTDGSVEIIKRYEKHLRFWCSKPDGGQARAINEGFKHATGDIYAWLNSDDFYLPGSLKYASEQLDTSRAEFLLGNCFHFVENAPKAAGSNIQERHQRESLKLIDYILQPSTFWTFKLWERVGPLMGEMTYAFDWDWFVRAEKAEAIFKPTARYLSAFRLYSQQKSAAGNDKRFQEIYAVYAQHSSARIVKLVDLCHQRYATFNKIRRRAKKYKISKYMSVDLFLKLLYPIALKDFRPEEIRDVMNMINP